eukprot:1390166-Pleurochrysis_carterae.AAC.1
MAAAPPAHPSHRAASRGPSRSINTSALMHMKSLILCLSCMKEGLAHSVEPGKDQNASNQAISCASARCSANGTL